METETEKRTHILTSPNHSLLSHRPNNFASLREKKKRQLSIIQLGAFPPKRQPPKRRIKQTHNTPQIPLSTRKLTRYKPLDEPFHVAPDIRVLHNPRTQRSGHVERAETLLAG